MSIANNAWLKYIDEVRSDPTNLYFCARLLEKAYLLQSDPDGVTLMRKAAMTVYKFDPLAYVTIFPYAVDMFSDDELEELTDALCVDGDDDLTNYLRGKLWSDLARHKKSSTDCARRGYAFLLKVSDDFSASEPEYLQALAECCRLTDYDAYKALVRRLLDSREAEWRGHVLINVLETTVSHSDWDAFDSWRPEWDLLPVNAHLCECSHNRLRTFDGLRALASDDIRSIPDLLRQAVAVRGCPHLNSGAANMDLVERLIERKVLLSESLAYVEACRQFCVEDDRIEPLIQRIELAQNE
jgi:hypothetical protein